MNNENSQQGFEDDQAGGIETIVDKIQRHLHQPFVIDPAVAVGGIGERIGVVNPALLPDVLAEPEVTPQIRVCGEIGKLEKGEGVHQDADHCIEAIPGCVLGNCV